MNRRTFLKHTGAVCGALATGTLVGPMSVIARDAAQSEQPAEPKHNFELESWLLATGAPYLDAQLTTVATQELATLQTQ